MERIIRFRRIVDILLPCQNRRGRTYVPRGLPVVPAARRACESAPRVP